MGKIKPAGEDGVRPEARYAARFDSAEQVKAFVWSPAMQRGLESAVEVVLLGDGAAWIWEHVAGVLGERTIYITDWYHMMEHIWACGKALLGEQTPQTTEWVKAKETVLWDGHYQQLLQQLEAERRKTRSLPKHQAIKGLVTYLQKPGRPPCLRPVQDRGLRHRLGPGGVGLQTCRGQSNEAERDDLVQRRGSGITEPEHGLS